MTLQMPVPPDVVGKTITLIQQILADHGDRRGFGSIDFSGATVRGDEGKKGDDPPMVIVSTPLVSDIPFGLGSGRTGLADYILTARLYGRKVITGSREATVLASVVRAGLHNHPPVVMGTVGIHRIRIISTGQVLRDPDTDEPFVPMTIGLYASSLEAAS